METTEVEAAPWSYRGGVIGAAPDHAGLPWV